MKAQPEGVSNIKKFQTCTYIGVFRFRQHKKKKKKSKINFGIPCIFEFHSVFKSKKSMSLQRGPVLYRITAIKNMASQ